MSVSLLVVEDEAIIAMQIEAMLTMRGYKVTVVSTHELAMETFRKNAYDVIMLDYFLKGRNSGIQTAREIRQDSQVPIIFISANATVRVEIENEEMPNTQFHEKPINFPVLLCQIKALCN